MDKIWIQAILLIGIGVVAVLLTRSTADARHQAVRRVLLLGFVLVAAASILFPTWLSLLARLLGVGRGTDLLLYGLVIAFLSYISTTYRRMKQMDRRITALTREIALAEIRYERQTPSSLPVGPPAPRARQSTRGAETANAAAPADPATADGQR